MVDCCKHSKTDKNCIRSSDKKSFKLPRKFSKKKCKNPKGFTMKSSCAPYKNCYSNKKRNKRKNKKSKKRSKKRNKKTKYTKLTKLGKEWVKLASEDMKKRELEFFKNTIKKNNKKKNTIKKNNKKKNTKKGGKKSKKPVVLPKLRPISYKNKKHRYHIKDPQKKRILAIEEGIQSESKNKRTKREAAIAKKARFNVLRIYRKNNNYKECKRLTDDMKYISKKYDLGETKNICLK